jgi:hypothetical protein
MGTTTKQGYFGTPPIVTNGLVMYLDAGNKLSYPGSGTVWPDLGGNGSNIDYTGSLVNTPIFNSSNQGSITFNGTNQYGQYGNILNPGTNNFSLGVWVKTTTIALGGIVGKHRAQGIVGRFGIYYTTTFPGKASCLADFTGITPITVVSLSNVNDGQWHYITQVAIRSGLMTIYFDGKPEASANISAGSAANLNLSDQYRLGVYMASGGIFTGASYFSGNIANIHQYNRALSDKEIAQNYNALKSRFGLS